VAISIVIILLRIVRGPKLLGPFRGAWYENQKEDFSMNRAVSLAVLAGGILLTIFGVAASRSFSSDISRFFTGSPTDKAIWMLVGGVVAIIIGLVGLLRGSKEN
jgi:Co/Zn/Cd efflux system component